MNNDYETIYAKARCVAWSHGYNLVAHGTKTRDLDLVAIPWTEKCCAAIELMKYIVDKCEILEVGGAPTIQPHGRITWTLIFKEFNDPRWVDLSIYRPHRVNEDTDKPFEFPESIICPWDHTATGQRIKQYKRYYAVKYNILKDIKPKRIVEIGVRAGYSAYAFMSACPNAVYIGYDADNKKHGGQGAKPFIPWAEKILTEAGFDNHINWPVNTLKLDTLPETGDFYHIDGDHTQKGVIHDLNLCFRHLPDHGHILIDDYDYIEGVKLGVDQWLADNEEKVESKYIKSLRGEILIWKKKGD